MSRCTRTDSLLDELFVSGAVTPSQREHVLVCSECARSLALARRFDRDLRTVGAELAPEPMSGADVSLDVIPPFGRGGFGMWRRSVLTMASVAVVLAVIVLGGMWINVPGFAGVLGGAIPADRLEPWLDRALATAHEASDGHRSQAADWEPAQVEMCGDTAIAFFVDDDEQGAYLWALGKPDDLFDQSIATGASRSVGEAQVARQRVELPVCEVVVGEPQAPADLADSIPFPGQRVVRVPGVAFVGDPIDAPVEVEVVGAEADAVEVGIFSDPYLLGRVEDPAVRAVDVLTPDGRYRYPVSPPGFRVVADVVDAAIAFEFLDSTGASVAAGPVLEGEQSADRRHDEEQRRAQAEAAAIAHAAAAHERRAQETGQAGYRCGEWPKLSEGEQLAITTVLVSDLEAARTKQQLPADASPERIIAAARASVGKGCQGSPADRPLADLAHALFGDER